MLLETQYTNSCMGRSSQPGPNQGIGAGPDGRRRWGKVDQPAGPPGSGPDQGQDGWGKGPWAIIWQVSPLIGVGEPVGVGPAMGRGCGQWARQPHF